MASDPAFLFYPGDYLRDTQCLSESSQVAYDRIMCEHMRNISKDMINIVISKERIEFFIKRLTTDQKDEIFSILKKVGIGYQITWVAESIAKRKNFSDSRALNRTKNKKDILTYLKDMENENENENENEEGKRGGGKQNFELPENLREIWALWIKHKKSKFKNKETEAIGKKKFFELCNGNPAIGNEIVEQSIANGWAGLFALKNNTGISKMQTMLNTAAAVEQKILSGIKNKENGNPDTKSLQ